MPQVCMAAKRKGEWNGRGTDRQAIQVEEGGIQAKNLFSLQLHVVCGEGRIPPLLSLTLSDFTFLFFPPSDCERPSKVEAAGREWRPNGRNSRHHGGRSSGGGGGGPGSVASSSAASSSGLVVSHRAKAPSREGGGGGMSSLMAMAPQAAPPTAAAPQKLGASADRDGGSGAEGASQTVCQCQQFLNPFPVGYG